MIKATAVSPSSSSSAQTRPRTGALVASGPFQAYQEVLSQTCKGFPEAWTTALQRTLSDYFENGSQTLDLSALPRGCLFAAKGVFDAFLLACDALDRPPVKLLLCPLRTAPHWVAKCTQLREIHWSNAAGPRVDFRELHHLHKLVLTGIEDTAKPALVLHLPRGCDVEGRFKNGNEAVWKRRKAAHHVSLKLIPSKANLNGKVTWDEAFAAQGHTGAVPKPEVSEGPIACRHFALRLPQLWAEQNITGGEPIPLNSAAVIAREIDPELDRWAERLVTRPAQADLVAIDQWQQHMQATFDAMRVAGEICRYGMLITINHELPFRLDCSQPGAPVVRCVDPNGMSGADCTAPYAFNELFPEKSPEPYLVDSPTQILLPPDGKLERKPLITQTATRSNHVLVVWLNDPLDLDSCVAKGAGLGSIHVARMGDKLTPTLMSEFVRLGADPQHLMASLQSYIRQDTTTSESLVELFASFSDNHAPLLAEAFATGNLPLVDVLRTVLTDARKLGLLNDEGMFVCLTGAGGYSRSTLLAALDSEEPQALPVLCELLLTLVKDEALSSATVQAILLDALRDSRLSASAAHRLTQLVNTLLEQGALTDEEVTSLREFMASRFRPKVKGRF